MTTEEKIEVVETVSEVFLEFNDSHKESFNIELENSVTNRDGYIDIGRNFDSAISYLKYLYSNHSFVRKEKKKLEFRISFNESQDKSVNIENANFILERYPSIEKRLLLLLEGYTLKSSGVALIAVDELVKLPFFEKDKDTISGRFSYRDYLSSYEKDWKKISTNKTIHLYSFNVILTIEKERVGRFKFLKKFFEFASEPTKISRRSKSGSTKEIDTIYYPITTNKSLSSSILLRDRLSKEEAVSGEWPMDVSNIRPDVLKWFRNDKNKLLVSLSNINFLKEKLLERGKIKCEYCNKGPLIIYDAFNKESVGSEYIKYSKFSSVDGATCDHKIPISSGIDPLDKDNLVVSCKSCNDKKGNMEYLRWINLKKN